MYFCAPDIFHEIVKYHILIKLVLFTLFDTSESILCIILLLFFPICTGYCSTGCHIDCMLSAFNISYAVQQQNYEELALVFVWTEFGPNLP